MSDCQKKPSEVPDGMTLSSRKDLGPGRLC